VKFLENTFISLCKGMGSDVKDGGGRNKQLK
jgi:hypothetical protein